MKTTRTDKIPRLGIALFFAPLLLIAARVCNVIRVHKAKISSFIRHPAQFILNPASALFYYPENFNARKHDLSKYNPTVEEVVDKALSYKPIQL